MSASTIASNKRILLTLEPNYRGIKEEECAVSKRQAAAQRDREINV
jgi:hypothetical protein